MPSMRKFGMAIAALGWLGLSGCSAATTTDGQVGQMGIPGPAGPVGPMGAPGTSGTGGTGAFDELDLPGTSFYPESINSAADGTMFVSSLSGPQVVKFAPGSNTPVKFITQLATGTSFGGLLVDETDKTLLACVNDVYGGLGTFKPLVKRYSLADGSEKASYEFAMPGLCNDLAFDGKHNLYVSDSFGKMYLLKNGTTTLSVWSSDPLLAPMAANTFGADGVAWDNGSNLYVTHIGAGYIVRIPIDATTGNAGTVVKITSTPALASPDGLRTIDANTLLVVEGIGAMDKMGAGRLTRLTLNGNNATGISLSNRLDFPSGVTKIGNDYWVSEGQIGKLFTTALGPPNLPFLVRRVPNF